MPRCTSRYEDLLQDESIDVVHVCTPNVSHCPITCAAFAAGKHVMCEKPMAATTADAEKMMAAWRASGKKFTIGYQNRFRTDAQMLKRACEEGKLGEILFRQSPCGAPPGGAHLGRVSLTSPSQGGGPAD